VVGGSARSITRSSSAVPPRPVRRHDDCRLDGATQRAPRRPHPGGLVDQRRRPCPVDESRSRRRSGHRRRSTNPSIDPDCGPRSDVAGSPYRSNAAEDSPARHPPRCGTKGTTNSHKLTSPQVQRSVAQRCHESVVYESGVPRSPHTTLVAAVGAVRSATRYSTRKTVRRGGSCRPGLSTRRLLPLRLDRTKPCLGLS
jgi:hypothetical protein